MTTSPSPRSLLLFSMSFAALVSLASPRLAAEPIAPTSLEEGCKSAPLIVRAELLRHQLETIPDGGSAKLDTEALWTEFRVTEVLFGAGPKAQDPKGRTLRLIAPDGGCIRFESEVTRSGDRITIRVSSADQGQNLSIKDLEKTHGQKLLLFLGFNEDPEQFYHFGGMLSPKAETPELLGKVRALIAARPKK